MTMRHRGWAVIALAVAAAIGYLVYTTTGTTAEYYRTIREARYDINAAADVRVLGTVQPGIKRLQGGQEVFFTASADGDSMLVSYTGTLPDIFRPGIQVVIEGHMNESGVFEARTLLAKCPSRFAAANPSGSP